MKGEVQAEELLTDAARRDFIASLLKERFTNSGKLFLPKYSYYQTLHTDDGLKSTAKEMFRWVGYKPPTLTVKFTKTIQAEQVYLVDKTHILVDESYRNHPLVVGGIIALAVTESILANFDLHDQKTTQQATIQFGLGLWVINALKPRLSFSESLYHVMDRSWQAREGLTLSEYTPNEYSREFHTFVHENRIMQDTYISAISGRAQHLIVSSGKPSRKPLTTPTIAQNHQHHARMLWLKLLILAAIAGVVVVSILFFISNRPPTINAKQISDEQSLNVIKQSLVACLEEVSEAQKDYNPDELYSANVIESIKVRCNSLSNQYDYALQQYRQEYIN